MTHAALVAQLSISSDAAGLKRDKGNQKSTAVFGSEDTGGVWGIDIAADGVEVELQFPGLSDAKAIFVRAERRDAPAATPDALPTLTLKLGSAAGQALPFRADDNEIALFLMTVQGVGSIFVTNPVPASGNPVPMVVTWGAVGSV